jgi:hypothetical protein
MKLGWRTETRMLDDNESALNDRPESKGELEMEHKATVPFAGSSELTMRVPWRGLVTSLLLAPYSAYSRWPLKLLRQTQSHSKTLQPIISSVCRGQVGLQQLPGADRQWRSAQ